MKVLIYGHLDVQPAAVADGWDTEPFVLTEKDGKLYGRGSTDDKGPVLDWINAIEAYKELDQEMPINLKFCFEGMEESGSENLDEELARRKDTFLTVKLKFITIFLILYFNVCIILRVLITFASLTTTGLAKTSPASHTAYGENLFSFIINFCLNYLFLNRGICYFFIEIESSSKDLHSGIFGGSVHESMVDLVALLNELVDSKGKILVPGIMDTVAGLTDEERKLYESIDFCPVNNPVQLFN